MQHILIVNELQGNRHLERPTHDVVYCVLELLARVMENWSEGGGERVRGDGGGQERVRGGGERVRGGGERVRRE